MSIVELSRVSFTLCLAANFTPAHLTHFTLNPYIALSFLVGADLAAPQKQHDARDNNPFKDPKTVVVPRILNKDDYDAGISALTEGNYQWNRYMPIERFNDIAYTDQRESKIHKLQETNPVRRIQALKSITTAKTKFATAFGPEFSGEINQTIDGARHGLRLVWAKAQDTNYRQLIELGDLLQEKTKQ
ncbi:hypothetical protein CRV24_008657 [Beauveria bassiana]|nr:hypothetical protein CRV24_008657 [Beauveria bassiana]KAH8715396.1 hypothetical protein HC256_004222 [Beauveria bassiana]